MNVNELKASMVPEMEKELGDILNYWQSYSLDNENGGFVGEVNRVGQVNPQAEKGAVLNARLLWTFSAAYNFNKDQKCLDLAKRAYDYLLTYFWDQTNGGVYWALDIEGNALNTRKQAYAQGFAIYGLSEYYKASGDENSLSKAIELYKLIERHYKDEEYNGYIEALDQEWQPMEDMRLSLKDANEPKSMNTHLHIIEPYTNLYRVWPDEGLKASIRNLIVVFRDHIIDSNTFHFNLFFDMDWKVKSNIVSYGHDIEGAWLLTEAAHFIHDEELLAEMREIAVKMVDATVEVGLDKDGSLFYEEEDGHVDTDKHWWPQAEAMVGFTEAFQITGNEEYLERAYKVWSFIKDNLIDKENGEWFSKVNIKGEPDPEDCKMGFWKCPYHNSRALIEVITRMTTIK